MQTSQIELIINTLNLIRILHNQMPSAMIPGEIVNLAPKTLEQLDQAIDAADNLQVKIQSLIS